MLRIHPRQRHVRYTLSKFLRGRKHLPRLFTPRNRKKKKKNTKFPFNLQRFIEEIVPRAKEIKEPCPDLRLWRLFISVESSRLLLVQISGNRFLLCRLSRQTRRQSSLPSSLQYPFLAPLFLAVLTDPCPRTILLRDSFRWIGPDLTFHPDDGIWILD